MVVTEKSTAIPAHSTRSYPVFLDCFGVRGSSVQYRPTNLSAFRIPQYARTEINITMLCLNRVSIAAPHACFHRAQLFPLSLTYTMLSKNSKQNAATTFLRSDHASILPNHTASLVLQDHQLAVMLKANPTLSLCSSPRQFFNATLLHTNPESDAAAAIP